MIVKLRDLQRASLTLIEEWLKDGDITVSVNGESRLVLKEVSFDSQEIKSDSQKSPKEVLASVGFKIDGNRISLDSQVKEEPEKIPVFDPVNSKTGDKVRVWNGNKWQVVIVPERDFEGNPIGEFAPIKVYQITGETFHPGFHPCPKPEKKHK